MFQAIPEADIVIGYETERDEIHIFPAFKVLAGGDRVSFLMLDDDFQRMQSNSRMRVNFSRRVYPLPCVTVDTTDSNSEDCLFKCDGLSSRPLKPETERQGEISRILSDSILSQVCNNLCDTFVVGAQNYS